MIAMYLSLYIAAQGQMVSTFDLVALLEGVTINERPEIRNAQVAGTGRYCLYGIHCHFCSRSSASRTPLEAQALSKLEEEEGWLALLLLSLVSQLLIINLWDIDMDGDTVH